MMHLLALYFQVSQPVNAVPWLAHTLRNHNQLDFPKLTMPEKKKNNKYAKLPSSKKSLEVAKLSSTIITEAAAFWHFFIKKK